MRNLLFWIWASALALGFTACSDDNSSSTGPEQTKPEIQDPNATPEERILATLAKHREEWQHVALVPGPTTKGLEEPLKKAGIKYQYLTYRPRNPQYYCNQLIMWMRNRGNAIWLVHDHTHQKNVDALTRHFLRIHKVEFEEKYEHLSLTRIINEFTEAGDAEKSLRFEPVRSQRGGAITNLVFTKDAKTLFYTIKHGVLRWLATDDPDHGGTLLNPKWFEQLGGKLFAGGESGFTGFALHPDFPSTPKAYLQFNYRKADNSRSAYVAALELDASGAPEKITVKGEPQILIDIRQVSDNHNAGQLAFGPDGFLYIAIGDGEEGKFTEGRSPSHTYRGKVLRIDVDSTSDGKPYGIPADNPFVGNEKFPPETWAWGFRNPWRMSFTPDGRILAGEIGEDRNEEITFVRRGRHHGWPFFEGTWPRNPWPLGDEAYEPPLFEYGRDLGMSVIGGYVYESDEISWLTGKYVFCDYLSGRIWAIELPAKSDTTKTLTVSQTLQLGKWPTLLTTFGKHPDGSLYVGTQNGRIHKLLEADGSAPEGPTSDDAIDDHVARGIFGGEFDAHKRNELYPREIKLGKKLFSDVRLSMDGKTSCATCHQLDKFGQDGQKVATNGFRNTPSIFNAHRQFAQGWDYRVRKVEEAVAWMLGDYHGFQNLAQLESKLNSIPEYIADFKATYGPKSATASKAARALGAFIRQLATHSRWDDYLDGDDDALTNAEKAGMSTFVNVGCSTCHQYRTLGGGMQQKLGLIKPCTGPDKGHGALPGSAGEDYYFKVSNLLNVAETAPYYHDGSIATLAEAVRHMADVQLNRDLSDEQVASIVTFLGSMTGARPKVLDGE